MPCAIVSPPSVGRSEVIDDDLGRSAAGNVQCVGFERMVAQVCLGKVGAVAAREVSRFARNSRDWQQLIEMCRVVDTVLIDQETIYAPRHSNDRLLLGLKGSLNEYELDLLRQRSLSARYEKARRGELVVRAPVGFVRCAHITTFPSTRLPKMGSTPGSILARLRGFSTSPRERSDWRLRPMRSKPFILCRRAPGSSATGGTRHYRTRAAESETPRGIASRSAKALLFNDIWVL